MHHPHHLLQGHPPPSKEMLLEWMEENGIEKNESVQICDMEVGTGWRVVANQSLEMGDYSMSSGVDLVSSLFLIFSSHLK